MGSNGRTCAGKHSNMRLLVHYSVWVVGTVCGYSVWIQCTHTLYSACVFNTPLNVYLTVFYRY